jgi:nucleoside-diphosphate-sugar epimerase
LLVNQSKFLHEKKIQKIIVTGGCGFIGSHLVDKSLEKKYAAKIINENNLKSIEQHY